jgi:hypothetical protein
MTGFDPGATRVPAPPPVSVPAPDGNGQGAGMAGAVPAPPPVLVREASAPRQWSVKALAAAVMFVVLGGLVVMYGAQAYSHRETVLVVARPVPVGSTITDADLTIETASAGPKLQTIKASDRASVVGKVALMELAPGVPLTRSQLGTSDGFGAGQVLVALPLKQGQLPARGLSAGQQVLIVATPGERAAATEPDKAAGEATPATGTSATVAEVGPTNEATGVTVVDVRMPASVGVAVAQLASTGNLALILLPPGGS